MAVSLFSSLQNPLYLGNHPRISACRNAVFEVYKQGRAAFSYYASRPLSSIAWRSVRALTATVPYIFHKVFPFCRKTDVHRSYAVFFPPLKTVSDDYLFPAWMGDMQNLNSWIITPEEESGLTEIKNALLQLPKSASIEGDILPLLRRIPTFARAWTEAGSPQIEEVGDEAFVDREGRFVFSKGTGAKFHPQTNTMQIHRNTSVLEKVRVLLVGTMNFLQKEDFLNAALKAYSGGLGREEYTVINAALEHYSQIWSAHIRQSLGFTIEPLSFSQYWALRQTIEKGASLSHLDEIRHHWDDQFGQIYFAKRQS